LKSPKALRTKTVNIRITGRKLPGIKFCISQGALVDREPVYLGIQKKEEVIDLVPGNVRKAVFNFPVDVITGSRGGVDFRGPYVHGKKGKRFVYLSWGELDSDGRFTMFRRAMLHFDAIKSKDLRSAMASSRIIDGTLGLTDDKGGPLSANIDSKITWRLK
jgi:hypothetical protein